MGRLVIACYRPRPGREADLLECVRDHVPTLRRLGLATLRPSITMRAADGTLLEVFEWTSPQAIERAHHDPVVRALWGRFEQACELVRPVDVAETAEMFAEFEPVEN